MSHDSPISHVEALRLIDARVGERVYFGFLVARGENLGDDQVPAVHVLGELDNPLAPEPPRLEPDIGFYRVGGEAGECFRLGPMAGSVHLRDEGVDFRIADSVTIRVAWCGSTEIGTDRVPGVTK
jgi:hypothetical protein